MADPNSFLSRLGRGMSTFAQLWEMSRQAQMDRELRRQQLEMQEKQQYQRAVEAGRPAMGGAYQPGPVASTEASFMGAIPGAGTQDLRALAGQAGATLGPPTQTMMVEAGEAGTPFAVAAPSSRYGQQIAAERVQSAIASEMPQAAMRERTAAEQASVDRFNELVAEYGDVETALDVLQQESGVGAAVGAAAEGALKSQIQAEDVAGWEALAAVAESKDEGVQTADDKIAIATREAGRELTPSEKASIEAAHERQRLIEMQAAQAEIDEAEEQLRQARFASTRQLAQDFGNRKEIQQFNEISQRYIGILDAIDRGSGFDEVIIVNNLAKMIDPESVVREGEFENVLRGMGLYDRIQQHLEAMKKGGVIDEGMKKDIRDAAQAVFFRSAQMANPVVSNFRQMANSFYLDPDMVISDYVGSLASLADRGVDLSGVQSYEDLVDRGYVRPPGARQ